MATVSGIPTVSRRCVSLSQRINHDQREYLWQLLLGAITGGAITETFGYLWVALPALAVMLYLLVNGGGLDAS